MFDSYIKFITNVPDFKNIKSILKSIDSILDLLKITPPLQKKSNRSDQNDKFVHLFFIFISLIFLTQVFDSYIDIITNVPDFRNIKPILI